MDDSLQGAIDPALQDPETHATAEDATSDHVQGLAEEVEPEASPAQKRKSRKQPKEPEQIFRRKEANRLAAERSRIRAGEKAAALATTHERLEQENRALKAELISLGVHDFGEPHGTTSTADVSTEIPAGDVSQSVEDDAQSRNILAALMKDAGIHMEDGEEASWMEGMENALKEAESGRLGDLAAVAADSHGDEGEAGPASGESAAQNGTPERAEGQASEQVAQVVKMLGYSAAGASEATLSALAVALNAEIERVVRDEYAATKTAIMQIEEQIAAIANGGPAEGVTMLSVSGTPSTVSLEDIETNQKESLASIAALQADIPANRKVMFKAEEEKVLEENKLAAIVEQVLNIRARAEDNLKTRLEEELRIISGYIGSLLASILAGGDAEGQRKAHLLDTPLSSPALAHRKRGRPRKGSTPLVYQQSALYRTPSTASGSPAQSSPGMSPKGRRRAKGAPGGSRLRESISASALNAHIGLEKHDELEGDTKLEEIGPDEMGDVPGSPEGGFAGASAEGSPVSVLSRFKKGEPGSCTLCGRTETSAWRKVIVNGEPLRVCNACGLYHSKFGVLRPSDLWGDGKGIRKRRSGRPSGADDDDAEDTPRKRTRGKGKQSQPDAGDDEDEVEEPFEGINDLEGITVDMVAEAVATAQAESGHATPAEMATVEVEEQEQEPLDVEPEDSGEIVVDEDLQKSFEQLTRHLEQQSRSGGGSLTADVFNV